MIRFKFRFLKSVRFIFLLISLLTLTRSQAQFLSDDTHISFRYSYGRQDAARYQNYGFQMELFLDDFISVNYQFELAYTSDKFRYLHMPMGIIAGPLLIAGGLIADIGDDDPFSRGKAGIALGVIMLIIPDGFALHLPIGNHIDISPYANILGLDFIRDRNTDDNWIKYSASFGGKISYLHKSNFTLSVFAEQRKAVRFPTMKGIGFGVGYYF